MGPLERLVSLGNGGTPHEALKRLENALSLRRTPVSALFLLIKGVFMVPGPQSLGLRAADMDHFPEKGESRRKYQSDASDARSGTLDSRCSAQSMKY